MAKCAHGTPIRTSLKYEINATYVVLRPDFYVAATANTPENLQRRFDEVLSRLRLTEKARATAGLATAGSS